MLTNQDKYKKIASVIRDAGGELIGRTRLQKIMYLLTAAGWQNDFNFKYHYYGPYSEDLATAALEARALGEIIENESFNSLGTPYSIYKLSTENAERLSDSVSNQKRFIEKAAETGMIPLELAATAAFLSKENHDKTPWETTVKLKENKKDYLEGAKELYAELRTIAPSLPELA